MATEASLAPLTLTPMIETEGGKYTDLLLVTNLRFSLPEKLKAKYSQEIAKLKEESGINDGLALDAIARRIITDNRIQTLQYQQDITSQARTAISPSIALRSLHIEACETGEDYLNEFRTRLGFLGIAASNDAMVLGSSTLVIPSSPRYFGAHPELIYVEEE